MQRKINIVGQSVNGSTSDALALRQDQGGSDKDNALLGELVSLADNSDLAQFFDEQNIPDTLLSAAPSTGASSTKHRQESTAAITTATSSHTTSDATKSTGDARHDVDCTTKSVLAPCPICAQTYPAGELESHAAVCMASLTCGAFSDED